MRRAAMPFAAESGALVLNALKTTLFSHWRLWEGKPDLQGGHPSREKAGQLCPLLVLRRLLRGAILLDDLSPMARITKLMRQNATEEETLA